MCPSWAKMQDWVYVDFKMTIVMNVMVSGCRSPCVTLWWTGWQWRVDPTLTWGLLWLAPASCNSEKQQIKMNKIFTSFFFSHFIIFIFALFLIHPFETLKKRGNVSANQLLQLKEMTTHCLLLCEIEPDRAWAKFVFLFFKTIWVQSKVLGSKSQSCIIS